MHTVIGAPNIGVARRISATSIEMNWDPLSEAASYSVRYRLVERVARRNLDDTYTTVETTNTNIIITDLDPRLGYAVSVAARTSVGVGNYSEEITVGCKLTPILVNVTCYTCLLWTHHAVFHNSLFQLHLFGSIICRDWVVSIDTLEHHYWSYTYWISCTQTSIPAEKANDIAEVVAREVQKICSCGLSDRYIGGMRLMCGSNNSTGQVVFLARMISLDGVNSTDLLPQLQRWTQTGPTITVQGVSLTISANCSVYLRDFSRPTVTCIHSYTTNICPYHCRSSWAQWKLSDSDPTSCWSWWRHAVPHNYHHCPTCNSAGPQEETVQGKLSSKQVWYSSYNSPVCSYYITIAFAIH